MTKITNEGVFIRKPKIKVTPPDITSQVNLPKHHTAVSEVTSSDGKTIKEIYNGLSELLNYNSQTIQEVKTIAKDLIENFGVQVAPGYEILRIANKNRIIINLDYKKKLKRIKAEIQHRLINKQTQQRGRND